MESVEKGTEVTLSDFEVRIARKLGSLRHQHARSAGIVDAKMGEQSNEETDVESMAAEIAFCKLFNLYPDLQIGVLPVFDAVLPCGATVDVKQTKYTSGKLLATLKKPTVPCDIYVLMTGTIPIFNYRGGYPQDLLFRDENIGDLGHGRGYIINQSKLWNVDGLVWRYEYAGESNG
jgi:hypothetical protein